MLFPLKIIMLGKQPNRKFKRGVLNFNAVCSGCGYKINKATSNLCHECQGGHDVHNIPQARSSLGKGVLY